MATYILSITGVIILTIIVDIVLSQTAFAKHVKAVMGLVCVFVIVTPIPGFINRIRNGEGLDFMAGLGGESLVSQQFVGDINRQRGEVLRETLIKEIAGMGHKVDCVIVVDSSSLEFKVSSISIINLNNRGLTNEDKNRVILLIKSHIRIDDGNILFM
ncbi:MAG: stage III sporulation protein AF [Firmicutes bacterium]|nr:stage III sporulation protein AF [Bacillota bacterium]